MLYHDGGHSETARTLVYNGSTAKSLCRAARVTKNMEFIDGGGGWSCYGDSLRTVLAKGNVGKDRHEELHKNHARNYRKCRCLEWQLRWWCLKDD